MYIQTLAEWPTDILKVRSFKVVVASADALQL